jgi:hypothetical protein
MTEFARAENCAGFMAVRHPRAQSSSERLLLVGGRVFPFPESEPIDNATVVIENVVLGSDPTQSVHAFTDVRYTIRSGRVVYAR